MIAKIQFQGKCRRSGGLACAKEQIDALYANTVQYIDTYGLIGYYDT